MKDEQPTYSKQVVEIADYIFSNPDKKTKDVIAVFCGKLRKSRRSVEIYIQKAKEYNKTRLQKQQQAKDDVLVKQTKEAVKLAILTRNERLEILSNIAKGAAWKLGSEIIAPNGSDRIKAIAEINKMEGDYAPTKTELTGKNGAPLNPGPLIIEIIDKREQIDENSDNKSI